MVKKQGAGLQSSAGLMRYYEADKKSIKVSPKIVLVAGIVVAVVVLGVSVAFGTWPVTA